MYESGHKQRPTREELRAALARVEEALARHEPVQADPDGGEDVALSVLRRSVQLLKEEADRLRRALAQQES